MVFSSIEFLFLFLPLFLLVQNLLPFRNLSYALFSVFFYFFGEGWYTAVVLISVAMNYGFGLWIAAAESRHRRKTRLVGGLSLNLAMLFFFKYAAFFLCDVLHLAGLAILRKIHLPLGISFFTFHSISYLIDVYRRDAKAERSFTNLALYILMFPQLIAGPILRFHTVANQLRRRVVTLRHLYFGFLLFCFGLGQKVLLADMLAGVADPLFSRADQLGVMEAWVAALSYSLQIFFDFSGYSNMAIGLGWMTGFHFPQNFNYPYISKSITEFWRRWHMSLSRWFRDYLYIPLGGNRHGPVKTYRNLLIVFLLCGLWHGAAWTFLAWGGYHGCLLVIERMGAERRLAKLPVFMQHGYTLIAVLVGWVLFRADNFSQAMYLIKKLFFSWRELGETNIYQMLSPEQFLAMVAAVLFSTPFIVNALGKAIPMPVIGRWRRNAIPLAYGVGLSFAVAVLGFASVRIMLGSYSPFIYFRF